MPNTMFRPTISAALVKEAIAGAQRRGLDPVELIVQAGMPEDLLQLNNAMVTLDQLVALHRIVSTALDDEYVGLLHAPQPIGTSRAMGLLAVHAKTIGEAMERTTAFYNLFQNSFEHSLVREGNDARYMLTQRKSQTLLNTYAIELFLCEVHRFYSWLIGDRLVVDEVRFSFSRDDNKAEVYPHFFFGGNIHFEKAENSIRFTSEYLNQPVAKTEMDLTSWIARSPIDVFLPAHTYGHDTLSVRNLLMTLIGENLKDASLAEVAHRLQRSPQALRRRLATEHTSFSRIKQQVLKDLAHQELLGADATIASVSEALGYSEPSAFCRAFRNWTGTTPFKYRHSALSSHTPRN